MSRRKKQARKRPRGWAKELARAEREMARNKGRVDAGETFAGGRGGEYRRRAPRRSGRYS